MFLLVFGFFRKAISDKPRVGLFVDGPNMIRKEFNLDLKDLRVRVEKYGRITIGKVFLNQFASEKLIEAVNNEGFEVITALGDPEQKTDVDVAVTVHAMQAIYDNSIDVICLASRDADFLSLIQKAKERGKKTVLIASASGLATSLKNASDFVEMIEKS